MLKSGYAKKILFLVDRRVLAAKAVSSISAFDTPDGLKLDKEYEVYSQKFKREILKMKPILIQWYYRKNISQNQMKNRLLFMSPIQRMTINLLGKEALGDFGYDVDVNKLDIPINAFDIIIVDECHRGYSASETGTWKKVIDYFDAVKIGLTATPATHTLAMFKNKIFTMKIAD